MSSAETAPLPCFGDDAEELLDGELSKLSLGLQEQILLDLHGVVPTELEDDCQSNRHGIHDEPKHESRQNKTLLLLAQALQNSLAADADQQLEAAAFRLAKLHDKNNSYIANSSFLSLFLRAHDWDHSKATKMVLSHFQVKRRLFGDGPILAREVCQSDLSTEDLRFLHQGMIQVLPQHDAAGRPVMISRLHAMGNNDDGGASDSSTVACTRLYRVMFYMVMAQLRTSTEAQQLGVVWIDYCDHGAHFKSGLKRLEDMHKDLCVGIPQRVVGGHFCGQDPTMAQAGARYQLNLPASATTDEMERFRKRYHIGGWKEIAMKLETYGINSAPDNFPMKADGTWSTENHKKWLGQMKSLEKAQAQVPMEMGIAPAPPSPCCNDEVLMPLRFDILRGKTKRSLNHSGNRRLVSLCELNYRKYDEATKHRRTELSDRIVSIIHESGGQFLRWVDHDCPSTGEGTESAVGSWVPVDDITARNKVSHVFRHLRAKLSKQNRVL